MVPDHINFPENTLHDEGSAYSHSEKNQLSQALLRNHTQRFEFMMELIKSGEMMKHAKITHKDMNQWISSAKK